MNPIRMLTPARCAPTTGDFDATSGGPTVRVLVIRCTVHRELDAAAVARHAADLAATVVIEAIAARATANVMFASGVSQLAFLRELRARPGIEWRAVTGFHMDEYVGVGSDEPESFARYLRENVAVPLGLGAVHALDGAAADPAAECRRYASLLAAHPLDLCCLGIGENGHLAFNDPPVADFADPEDVKVVALDPASKRQQVGEGHFPVVDAVPPEAMTVTIPALVRARVLLVVVPETRKAVAVRAALEGPVSPSCPASILQTVPHAHVFVDRDAAALMTRDAV
jgi:glucosamine-6-phosphate deaminase